MEQILSALRRSAWLYGILLITTGLPTQSPGQNPAGKPRNAPPSNTNSTLRLEVTEPRGVAVSREVHYGFPRLVRAKNGGLLLFYRVGTTHARDYSAIAMRTSGDDGASWSPERILHRDPDKRRSAHNPVALVTRSGRVLLWTSSFGFQERPRKKDRCYWAWSDDHGETWSQFTVFDSDPTRGTYYVPDAVLTSEGILAGGITFPPSGVGNAYTVIWRSGDDGRTWSVRSMLTLPSENLGDEVTLMETEPGTILCLLRARLQPGATHKKAIYRLWSEDGGRTWSQRENIYSMLDCILQRPFLTRLDRSTLLLSGRDFARKKIVVYISTDNGRTFGHRHELDHFTGDGGYTSAVRLSSRRALMAYYSDSASAESKPDIKQVVLTLSSR